MQTTRVERAVSAIVLICGLTAGCSSDSNQPASTDRGSAADLKQADSAATDSTTTSDAGATRDTAGVTDTNGVDQPPALVPKAIVQVATGKSHTCALFDTGDVRCWGINYGRLGYPDYTAQALGDKQTPKDFGRNVQIGGKVVQIKAGEVHTCALLDTKRLRCWGSNISGQLGYGNDTTVGATITPAEAGDVDVGGDVVDFSLGGNHTCAVLSDGSARCWGGCSALDSATQARKALGLCGNPELEANIGDDEKASAAPLLDVGAKVLKVAAGDSHTCLLIEGNKVRCFGAGSWGRLGYGDSNDIVDHPKNIADVDLGSEVPVDLVAGQNNTCARFQSNKVLCWGAGNLGVTANAGKHLGDNELPSSKGSIDLGGANVNQLAISPVGNHVCALLDSKKVRCWGSGSTGKLGYGDTATVHTPATTGDVDVGEDVSFIAAGGSHSCVVTATGQLRCWGSGTAGQLGHGNTNNIGDNETPASIGDIPVF